MTSAPDQAQLLRLDFIAAREEGGLAFLGRQVSRAQTARAALEGALLTGVKHAENEAASMASHGLMNPWSLSPVNAQEESYLSAYCHFLAGVVKALASFTR